MSTEKVTRVDREDHKALALWAAECAEHVLPHFEEKYPKDDRPRRAIEAARAWVRGDIGVGAARGAASAAHAAARDADEGPPRAAARAAGHAAATAHAAGHAKAAGAYAAKAAAAAGAGTEQDWQSARLPVHLRAVLYPRKGDVGGGAGAGDRLRGERRVARTSGPECS